MSFGNPFATSQGNGNSSYIDVQSLGYNGFEVSLNYISGVPDPNIVANSQLKLIFKSLMKRDELTKEKALNELINFIKDENHLFELKNDLVLITWTQLYPKIATSESKTVRYLSHQVQTMLISSLKKVIMKYLKDSVPVLLSGLFDMDAIVVNSTKKNLLECFNNDQSKVDNLWNMFQLQILNFIEQVFNVEKVDTLSDDRVVGLDEATLKYLRLVNATVCMFNQLLQITAKSGKLDEKYKDVLLYENLWHYLLINSNSNNQRIYKSLINTINISVKAELLTKKSWKLISKRIFNAIAFAKKVSSDSSNSLVYTSIIIPTLSTILNMGIINPDFYTYDKSAVSKIMEFLRLGSLNSDPSYYKYLMAFVEKSGLELNLFELENILMSDFEQEVSRNLKLRNGGDFIINSLIAYLHITSNLDAVNHAEILKKCLNIKSPITNRFIEPLSKYLSQEILESELKKADIQTIEFLLKVSHKQKMDFSKFLESSLNTLRNLADEDESGETFATSPTFSIFEFVIKIQDDQYIDLIKEFIDEIPGFITIHTIPQSISILIAYSYYKQIDKELFMEAFDNSLAKLILLDSKDSLIQKLDKFQFKEELLKNSEELRSVVCDISSTYDFKDDNLFKEHLINKDSLIDFYQLSLVQGKFSTFLEYYWKYNSHNKELLLALVNSTDFLDVFFCSPDAVILSTIHEIVTVNEKFKDKYVESMKSSFENIDEPTLSQIKEYLKSNKSLAEELAFEDQTLDFVEAYGDVIDSRLSIGNPLDVSIYLLPTEENVFPFENLKKIINYANFLIKLDLPFNDEALVYLNIIKEVAIDYDFLNDVESDQQGQFTVIGVKLLSRFSNLSYTFIIEQIVNKSIETPLLSHIIDEEIEIIGFYKLRLLERILSNYEPHLTKELNFQPFIRSAMRDFGLNTLKVITTLKGLDFSSSQYERLRNFVGSEIVGIRPSNILTEGLAKLLLLNRFIEHASSSDELFPANRFNMIIAEMNKWIESDVSYESAFSHLRIVLIKTLINFNLLNFDKSGKFMELTDNLVTDSIGFIKMANGEEEEIDDLIELKYFSLKLYLVLERQGVEIQVKDDLLEVFLAEKFIKGNQPNNLYGRLLIRFIDTLPIRKFKPLYDDLIVKNSEISGNYDIKRGILDILKRIILDRQQDIVVEFELNKEEDISSFKIESTFIENVLNTPKIDHLESEDDSNYELIKYLWNWELLLLKFTDISLKLRGVYIQQLQSHDELIIKFLNFIAFLVNGIDKFENFDNYDIVNYNFVNEYTLDEEIKVLSIHLYYKLLVSIGSLSNQWFNEIKDRNFKTQLENFTIKYISPRLIVSKLSDFESKSSKLTNEDDNLTIKINRIMNEVKAIYLIDEQTMEIVFKIPNNYPLTNIEVIGSQRIGVKEPQWKSWVLSSQTIISFQNGSILESLEFFLKNVSYHFKGFEECAICYSILHSDNSLPSKNCQTCKNKFHSGCLYKWFKSSGGNTCPLCRSTFNFR